MNENKFAYRLIALIKDQNISERAFSEKIGKSYSYINSLKKESCSPSLKVLTSILDICPQVNLYWLALGVGSMYLTTEDVKTYMEERHISQNKDYKTLFEEERKENAILRQELHESHNSLIELMKKQTALLEENTSLRLSPSDNST